MATDLQNSGEKLDPFWLDSIIEVLKKDVDRTLLRENLKLTVSERIAKLQAMQDEVEEMRAAVRRAKALR